jgi:branched-chain amino acid transport system ATP-binding protein
VESLDVTYGSVSALRGVSFAIETGQTLAVLGANGAGKSTLARACSGLVRARRGHIWFDGHEITNWPAHRIRRAGLIYLPEGRGVLPGLSVIDNLRMAVRIVDRSERPGAIERVFDLFPVLAKRQTQRAGSLSGGEQQMLSLARGLSIPPKLILADELSLGLAPRVVDVVFESLAKAKNLGVTILLIEQFVHRALGLSDRCLILGRGATAWEGSAGDAAEEVAAHYIGTLANETSATEH